MIPCSDALIIGTKCLPYLVACAAVDIACIALGSLATFVTFPAIPNGNANDNDPPNNPPIPSDEKNSVGF